MDMRARKKPPMRKSGAMAFALKQWNKVAPEYKLIQTQRKDQVRLSYILKMVSAMEAASMDWRDKEVWRGIFRKLGQSKHEIEREQAVRIQERRDRKIERLREANPEDPKIAHLESIRGESDFCLTFDWAICLHNIGEMVGLSSEGPEIRTRSRSKPKSSPSAGADAAGMCV